MRKKTNAFKSVTFKKDKYAWWGLGLIVLLLVVSFNYFPWHSMVEFEASSKKDTSNPKITVLYFDHVVLEGGDDTIHQKQLKEQLQTLKENGYNAISLKDLRGFYYENKKLPEKSLFLVFGNGYLETYAAADPVLRELKWPAMVSVITEPVERRETFFLYWDRLRKMLDSGLWSVASSGHLAQNSILVSQDGQKGRYLGDRLWLKKEMRFEDDNEFATRVKRDFKQSLEILEKELNPYHVVAYSPLFGIREQLVRNSPYSQGLEANFALSFVDSFVGVNDKKSDPLRLRRLRVKPAWSPTALLSNLETALQAPTLLGPAGNMRTTNWFRSDGGVVDAIRPGDDGSGTFHFPGGKAKKTATGGMADFEGPVVHLESGPKGQIWVPGGNFGGNWILDLHFVLENGELGVHQKSQEGGDEWRWGGRPDKTFFQMKRASGLYENLTTSLHGIRKGKLHHLKLIKRGLGISAILDGQSLWQMPIHIQDEFLGDIGVFVWSQEGSASLWVHQAKLSLIPYDFRWLSSVPGAEEVQSLIKQKQKVSAISATTHILTEEGLIPVDYDEDLFKIVAKRYAWEFIPAIEVYSRDDLPDGFAAGPAINFKKWVEKNKWQKVHLNLDPSVLTTKKYLLTNLIRWDATEKREDFQWIVTSGGRPDASKPLYEDSNWNEGVKGLGLLSFKQFFF